MVAAISNNLSRSDPSRSGPPTRSAASSFPTLASATNPATGFPRLTVGMPVYNGERFVSRAIESFLNQTFTDFDLVISDNASTDATESICRDYAAKDTRIRYSRNAVNMGAGPNLNRVYEVSRLTPYFKWAAADDAYAPTYLQTCMGVLEADASVVLCHSRTLVIDEQDRPMKVTGGPTGHYAAGPDIFEMQAGGHGVARWADHYDPYRKLDSASAATRFAEIVIATRRCFEIWGVMRRSGIERTYLHESYYGSDKVMLSALSLAGRFIEVPEPLYFRRHHDTSSDSIKSAAARDAWMDTRKKKKRISFARLSCLSGYHRALAEAPLTTPERAKCYVTLAKYLARTDRWLAAIREAK